MLRRLLRDDMYYIGLDVHKQTISYCVKDAAGCVHQEGKIGASYSVCCWAGELFPWVSSIAGGCARTIDGSAGERSGRRLG